MHLTENNISALAEVADDILGAQHPVTQLIRALLADPDLASEAWRAVESLPQKQRKIFAAMVAERLEVNGPSRTVH